MAKKGKDLIFIEVLKRCVINLLNFEKELVEKGNKIKILSLENKLTSSIRVKNNLDVLLTGAIADPKYKLKLKGIGGKSDIEAACFFYTQALVMALEEEFDAEIPDEEAEKIATVQDAITYISANG